MNNFAFTHDKACLWRYLIVSKVKFVKTSAKKRKLIKRILPISQGFIQIWKEIYKWKDTHLVFVIVKIITVPTLILTEAKNVWALK